MDWLPAIGVRLGVLGALILYITGGTHGCAVPATSASVSVHLLAASTDTEREEVTRQQMCVCL